MTLSLLTFSFMGEVLTRQMNAEKLCEIAKENKIESLDMMTKEIHLYKARALKKAFETDDLSAIDLQEAAVKYLRKCGMDTAEIQALQEHLQ